MDRRGLRIGLVSAYPPGTRPLSEYAGHLVAALCANDRVERICVLADRVAGRTSVESERLQVIPCWRFGSAFSALSVVIAARRLHLDVLWFNMHMTSAGNNRASWFGGVCAPAIARAAGFKVVVTLHNMLGVTDLRESGVRPRRWDVAAAHAATGTLRWADMVCTLRPEYVRLLKRRYGMTNVSYMPHGTLGTPVCQPGSRDGRTILVFGRFGTYKRLEPVIEAVAKLSQGGLDVRLLVAGRDSRHSSGYLAGVEQRYRSLHCLEFLGYVPEHEVSILFQRASLCVMPYATMAGMSGVAVLASMYGVPIVASDIPEFRTLRQDGLVMHLFRWPNVDDLARVISCLLNNPEERDAIARANLDFIDRQDMSVVAAAYLRIIDSIVQYSGTPRPDVHDSGVIDVVK